MGFRDFGSTVGGLIYRQIGRARRHVQRTRPLPADILETDTTYLAVFDAPGTDSEDVQVRYVGGGVRVRIDRFRPHREGFRLRYAGRSMELDGEVALPEDAIVQPDAATARLTDAGELHVEIPKRSASQE